MQLSNQKRLAAEILSVQLGEEVGLNRVWINGSSSSNVTILVDLCIFSKIMGFAGRRIALLQSEHGMGSVVATNKIPVSPDGIPVMPKGIPVVRFFAKF